MKRVNRRKQKSRLNHQAKRLNCFSFVEGCRGHPGILMEKNICRRDPHGSDVTIRSLIDGVYESCSILHCSPSPITGEYARWVTRSDNFKLEEWNSWLRWYATFDDFDEDYTVAQFIAHKIETVTKFQEEFSSVTEKTLLHQKVEQEVTKMTKGEPFGPVKLYSFEKYRRGKPRKIDFATDEELANLVLLGPK